MSALKFCDVAMLYCPRGGGIRTYCEQKLDWFSRQRRHAYTLIVPGARTRLRWVESSVSIVEIRGVPLDRDPDGYRVFADIPALWNAVRRSAPDLLEAGDPWISGPLSLLMRRRGHVRRVASFCHADPRLGPGRLQSSYDATLAASRWVADRLTAAGVARVRVTPFGVDPALFEIGAARVPHDGPLRLLYAGRLDRDKEVRLLLEALPALLDTTDAAITVAGRGALEAPFKAVAHPRFAFAGYVADRARMLDLYRTHDVLVSTCGRETFGLSVLEAAAAGLVIVGPDGGGAGEMLRSIPAPFVFRRGDSASLLAAVREALASDRRQACDESRRMAAGYGTWSDAIGRLVATCEQIVDGAS